MWQEQLKKVENIEHSFGEKLRTGAAFETIKEFFDKTEKKYGLILPSAYRDFLSMVDGFDFNGYCVFGTTEDIHDHLSMIGQNDMFHHNAALKRYWFFGTSDMSWYVFDLETKQYLEVDAAEVVWNQFHTFEEMLGYILESSIGEG